MSHKSREVSPAPVPVQQGPKIYQIPRRVLMRGIAAGVLGATALARTAYSLGKFGPKGTFDRFRNKVGDALNYGWRVSKAVYNTPYHLKEPEESIHKGTESEKNYPKI